jgi:DNA-binding response OmpR family regulator
MQRKNAQFDSGLDKPLYVLPGDFGAGSFHLTRGKILVVDDDRKIVGAIKLYLENDGFEVTTAHDGQSALENARTALPDLIVLDLMLPKIGGLDVCRILRSKSNIPIVMLTARTTEEDKLRGLGIGADDYITKPFSPRELVARVHTILRRTKPNRDLAKLQFGDLTIDMDQHEVKVRDSIVQLTPAEFKLLESFVRAPNRVFSRQELIRSAFGHDYEGLERTIDVHVKSIRKKIESGNNRPSPIVTVYGVGYKFSTVRDDK